MRTVYIYTKTAGRQACYIRRRIDGTIEALWYDDQVWFRPDVDWHEGLDAQGHRTIAEVLES